MERKGERESAMASEREWTSKECRPIWHREPYDDLMRGMDWFIPDKNTASSIQPPKRCSSACSLAQGWIPFHRRIQQQKNRANLYIKNRHRHKYKYKIRWHQPLFFGTGKNWCAHSAHPLHCICSPLSFLYSGALICIARSSLTYCQWMDGRMNG